jgi:HEAT repeat protein
MVVATLLVDERHGSFGARAIGARLLGECGPAAQSTIPAVSKLLKDPDGDVRVAAAEALLKMAPDAPGNDALGTLRDALRSRDLLTRVRAAEALGGRGAQAKDALPALLEAVQDGEPEVRQAAQAAIQKVRAGDR